MPRSRLRQVTLAAGVLLVLALAIPISLGPTIKRRLMDAVGQEFDSQVEVEDLSISMLPRPRVRGRGLVLRHRHRTDIAPLITIASFSAEVGLFGALRAPLRVSRVDLVGLEINIPPGGIGLHDNGGDRPKTPSDKPDKPPLIVSDLTSERAVLRILRKDPGKQPRLFDIHHLVMADVGADHGWPFSAELTNPKPPGEIRTHGTFGPWNADDPSQTALDAAYQFDNADLGVFDGIQGVLSSTGAFKGVLERIEVEGQTRVPAFALTDAGNTVDLATTFHAIVDGTNGNTLLQPVDARFLHTNIHASGGVVEREGQDGRTVELDLVMTDARLEDVLRLAVKGNLPPMAGQLTLKAKLQLPPGHVDAMQKLRLDGTFDVARATFSKATTQSKMNEFSTKARGVSDQTPDPVTSSFKGRFKMNGGVLHFADVTFEMPGASVNVAGDYVMKTQAIDFRGTVRLQAKLSQLTTGAKSFLLGMFNGLFRHKDVTVIPITIGGDATAPKVRLDYAKALGR